MRARREKCVGWEIMSIELKRNSNITISAFGEGLIDVNITVGRSETPELREATDKLRAAVLEFLDGTFLHED